MGNRRSSTSTLVIDEFERVLISTVQTFTGEELERENFFGKEVLNLGYRWIGSEISLDGVDCSGSLSFCMTSDAAIGLTRAMIGSDLNEVNGEVTDTVAEITNIIAGGAKSYLSSQKLNPDYARPQPLSARAIQTLIKGDSDSRALFYSGFGGHVLLLIHLVPLS